MNHRSTTISEEYASANDVRRPYLFSLRALDQSSFKNLCGNYHAKSIQEPCHLKFLKSLTMPMSVHVACDRARPLDPQAV